MDEKNLDNQNQNEDKENEVTDFKDLFPKELPGDLDTYDCTITFKDGRKKDIEVREFAGTAREDFLKENSKKMDRDGKSIKEFKDVQVILLRKTIFEKGATEPLPDDELRNLPAKTQQLLYEMSIKMCGLDKEAMLQAKKK